MINISEMLMPLFIGMSTYRKASPFSFLTFVVSEQTRVTSYPLFNELIHGISYK